MAATGVAFTRVETSTCLDSSPEAEAATGAVFPRVETSASLDSSTEAEAALGCREGARVRGMSVEGRLVR